jgi:hypothetical protein
MHHAHALQFAHFLEAEQTEVSWEMLLLGYPSWKQIKTGNGGGGWWLPVTLHRSGGDPQDCMAIIS